MLKQMGPPETTVWEYPFEDNSWKLEIEQFYKDIDLNRPSNPGISDAIKSMEIINKICKESGYDYSS